MQTTNAPASPTVAVGDISITALLDVDLDFPLGIDQVFTGVSEAEWEGHRARCPGAFSADGGWRYVVTCYLLRGADRCVLVDTGCGARALAFPSFLGVEGQLGRRLAAVDVAPEEVDTVVITHIHPDHVGGLVTSGEGGDPGRAFPRARIVVPSRDWDAWRRPDVQEAFPVPYVGDTIGPLVEAGDVDLVDGEHDVSEHLRLLPTPGHTPGSSSLLIDSGGERAILVGDLWLHPAQVTDPAMRCAFDMEPEVARETRARLAERIGAEGLIMGACHFPEPFGELVRLEGRHHWMPVAHWRGDG
ncbi:MAG TPA: MBL fold metallo-hydrolase [Miltoncostaeaceae bacterium]|nr:MBL fold metallo-hydrolase [Miltoncostaeaceae bacterium]